MSNYKGTVGHAGGKSDRTCENCKHHGKDMITCRGCEWQEDLKDNWEKKDD